MKDFLETHVTRFTAGFACTSKVLGVAFVLLAETGKLVTATASYPDSLEIATTTQTSGPPKAAMVCAPIPSGLVAWWPGEFDARDLSEGNNGAIVGAVAFEPGKVGEAFSLSGGGEHILVKASTSLNVGSGQGLTFEGWINPITVQGQQPILEWEAGQTFGAHFYISVIPPYGTGTGCLYGNLVDPSGVYHPIASPPGSILAARWQHVALTYDRATGQARLYLNANVIAEKLLGQILPQTSFNLLIGYRPLGLEGGPLSFRGQLDEISIYNRALSTEEIAAIFNADSAGKCVPSGPAPTNPPAIVLQPQSQLANSGDTVQFTTLATGLLPLSYQWFHNHVAIPGATNAILLITSAQGSDNGDYFVVASNSGGQATSQTATLTVNNTLGRVVRILNRIGAPGSTVIVPIDLSGLGNENALGFSLLYDPSVLSARL